MSNIRKRGVGGKRSVLLSAAAVTALAAIGEPWAVADNVTLNNGDTLNYTPSQLITTAGVTQRLATGQFATSNSDEINYNATATSTATPAQFIYNSTTLDTITGLTANTALETVSKLNITTGGAYTIYYNCDDGGRLYIDGQLIINNEGGHGTTPLSKVVNLDAGLHDLRGFVINNGGGGGVQLSYSGPDSATRVLVPTTALFQAENTSANAISSAVSTTVRANNITPITVGTAPDNLTLTAGAAATISLNGSAYAIAGLGTLTMPAGTGLNVTGTIGAGADTRRQLHLNATTLGGAGTYTFNNVLDLNPGQITGSAASTTIVKLGAGRLILDNSSSGAANDLTGGTIDVQGGGLYVLGNPVAGSTNPLSTATVNLNGTTLQLDVQGNGAANTAITFNNVITLGASGGTIQALTGPATYTLGSTTAINVPSTGTLTLNTFGGSHIVAGATLLLNAPLTGTGALVKNATPGSTAGTAGNVVGVAANRDTGTVILAADSSGFSGPVTLATTTLTAPAITVQPGILEGRAATATAKPFGTGTLTLQGGQLNLRGGAAAAATYALGNNTTVTGNVTLDLNLYTGTATGSTFQLGTLALGSQTVTVNTGNTYQLAFGATTLSGNPTINTNTNSPRVTLGALNDAGTARTFTKSGTGDVVLNQTATSYTGTFTISGGALNATAQDALGSAAVNAAAGGAVILTAQNALAKYDVAAGATFGGNTAGFTGITRTAAAPAAGQVRLATGAVVAETAAGVNSAFATSGNLGTASDLLFGLAADVSDSVTIGQGTPWRGLANDRGGVNRTFTGGTVTAKNDFAFQGIGGGSLILGGVTLASSDAVTGTVTAGRILLSNNNPNYGNTTFVAANGGAIQFNVANSLGSSATGSNNRSAIAYNNGTLDPGPAGSVSGPIFLETGSFLTLNDANNLGGVGTIGGEPGAVLDFSGTPTNQLANGNATQNVSGLPAGVVHRLSLANIAGLGTGAVTGTNPAGNYEVNGSYAETITVSAGTPTRSGFASGVVTANNAAQTLTGSVVIGPNGGTIAASTGGTLTENAPITVTGTGGRALSFGSNLIIDPAINAAIRNGTVLLGGANVYGAGGDAINQVNVRGRSTVQGTPTGAGSLPQGTGVGLNLGGIFQVNGPAAGGTLQFGALTPNGGVLFLNRNATPTAGLIANFNAPVNRPSTFGPENRGSVTFQLLSGQNLGTSTDKITFSSAANAPSRITVNGTGGAQQINMLPPWMVATSSNATANETTFLDTSDPAGAGLVPVTYTALPTSGGTGVEIADATAATALTGDVTVAALRTNSNISGAFTINLTSGGFIFRGGAAANTISANLNFGANEGVIGNVNSNQANTISGQISGTGGLTKFGGNSLVLSNVSNSFSGGLTIDESNLRPGVASTGTNGPFGVSGGVFNVVTINTAGVLDLNGQATRIGGLQGVGLVNDQSATAATLTLDVPFSNTLTFNGTIGATSAQTTTNGAISLTKTGSGTQILAGDLNYTGATTVSGGVLRIEGNSTAASNYTVASGATLGGSGIITGTVTIASGGILSPGSSPGILRTGSLTLSSGSNYAVELNGPTAGPGGYDQTDVVGAVTLAGANLVPTLNYIPAPGDKFYIINNDGFDAVSGTFAGLTEGSPLNLVSTIDSQTYAFTVSYTGEFFGAGSSTTGNDVLLTAAVPEPTSVGLLALGVAGLLARRRSRGC